MWIPQDPNKYVAQFKYVEIGRYVPSLDKLIRKQTKGKSILVDWGEVERYRKENKGVGIYTSVFSRNRPDINHPTQLGSLYFDLDCSDVSQAHEDAIRLVNYLYQFVPAHGVRVYFSGAKGFHVECEAVTLGISPNDDPARLYRYIATQLRDQLDISTFDFSVFDTRRMWRLPNSQHQKTGLFKVDIGERILEWSLGRIRDWATEPHFEQVVPEQAFDPRANEWYREWTYKIEEPQQLSSQELLDRFNKHGTKVLRKETEGESQFDPENLLDNCPSVLRLWEKAEKTHDLAHDERLFLCSILTYTPEAIEYLHAILRNVIDYNENITQAHIDDWVRRRQQGIGGKPFTCRAANERGVGCGADHCSKLEPKERVEKVGDKLIATGQFRQPSPIRYAYNRVTIDRETREENKDGN